MDSKCSAKIFQLHQKIFEAEEKISCQVQSLVNTKLWVRNEKFLFIEKCFREQKINPKRNPWVFLWCWRFAWNMLVWPYSHVILTPSGRLHCSCPAAAWSARPRRPPAPGQSWAPPPARAGSSHPPPGSGTQSHRGRAGQVRIWRIPDRIFFEWILRLLCLILSRWVWN